MRAKWVAILTVTAVLAVFSALALRTAAGDDPAIGLVQSTTSSPAATGDDATVDDLLGDDGAGSAGSSFDSPGSAPTTRAS